MCYHIYENDHPNKMKSFEVRLKGGHPNSSGNTVEIVDEVLEQKRALRGTI